MPSASPSPIGSAFRQAVRDLLICLQFYSRLPDLGPPWTMPELTAALRFAPLAGALIGFSGAVVLLLFGASLMLPAWLAATLSAAAVMMLTGALHEDGLADVVDGFGGGGSVERKLEIMKDSRIGTFGTLALALLVAARLGAMAAIVRFYGYGGAAAALVAAAAASRGFGLLPLTALGPARSTGLGQGVGRLASRTFTIALVLAALACLLPALADLAPWRPTIAGILALLVAFGMTWLARRQIGGQTGDVAGATQQVCEIAYLMGLLIAPEGS